MIIETMQELKELCKYRETQVAIMLNGGVHSTKELYYNPKTNKFQVFSSITGTAYEYSEEELAKFTNIVKAMELGALVINN